MKDWVKTSEQLPEPKQNVIYWHELFGYGIGYYDPDISGNYQWIGLHVGTQNNSRVLAWSPLPEPYAKIATPFCERVDRTNRN